MKSSDFLKHLPSVNDLLENPQVKSVVDRLNRSTVTSRMRSFLDELRAEVLQRAEDLPLPSLREVVDRVTRYVSRDEGWSLCAGVNATGCFRGGAWESTPLADAAVERMLLLSKDYTIASSEGVLVDSAYDVQAELQRLTGAEAAAVFNSRAGALALALSEVACHGRLVVARTDLGEVAPGCRLTDLCNTAGARICEVGATDCVTPGDYADAMEASDSVVLRRVPEAYRMVGATPRPTTGEIAGVVHAASGLLIEDLGAAPLVDLPGVEGTTVDSAAAALAAGADLVLLRGDGMLGGPECCVVLGKRSLIEKLQALPLASAYRASALTLAALAATVKQLGEPERAVLENPLLTLLTTPIANLRQRAERLAPQIEVSPAVATVEVLELAAEAGVVSGLPLQAPTVVLSIAPASDTVEALRLRLAASSPAVWGRIEAERLVLDLRTIFPRQDMTVVSAFPTPSNEASPIAGQDA